MKLAKLLAMTILPSELATTLYAAVGLLWQRLPFNNIFRICAFGTAAIVAWKKENIYISMMFHTLCTIRLSARKILRL